MREIKFRAWKKYTQKYLEADELLMNLSNGNLQDLAGGTFRPSDVKVEQFAGLKDRNGVDIYEGDIVTIPLNEAAYSNNTIAVISYNENSMLLAGSLVLSRIYTAVEVIGNIHENTGLLDEISDD